MGKIEPVSDAELQVIMPPQLFSVWRETVAQIETLYEMERVWDKGYKDFKYVLRFRRGGKTLVSLFVKEDAIGVCVIYGKDERSKFELNRASFSDEVLMEYNNAHTYHDGKWMLFHLWVPPYYGNSVFFK